jgi:hypothetical protein
VVDVYDGDSDNRQFKHVKTRRPRFELLLAHLLTTESKQRKHHLLLPSALHKSGLSNGYHLSRLLLLTLKLRCSDLHLIAVAFACRSFT